jgi:CheY-like chemotaxis protein/anti-sigma regulatory factor (Ser/Thr protein kinase)
MPVVLVVDDSEVDRRLAGGLLEKEDDLSVQHAASGAEALAAIERAVPDLVLTDLVMPEMDGLELVAAVRSTYPSVPVILMTAKGSEEIAARALREGAASYVPKRTLAQELVDTVQTVLSVAGRQRTEERLLGGMTRNECAFELDNDRRLITPLIGYLQETAMQMGLCDEAERIRLGIALEEALVNSLYHGNLEVGSELRGSDYEAYYKLIEQRRRETPYRDRRIRVEARLSRREAAFVIRDEGPGFDPSTVKDPTDPENWENVTGRGLLLMRTFMDEVIFNDVGNEVTLIKRHQPGGSN